MVAFFHIQNSSNCCRHNNDRSISRVFYVFFFPGLWLSQNWPNKCLTPKTWWPLAIPVTVGTWLWPPFSEAACPWRRLTNKCWTSKTRTGKFSIKFAIIFFSGNHNVFNLHFVFWREKLNKIVLNDSQCMLCNSWWLVGHQKRYTRCSYMKKDSIEVWNLLKLWNALARFFPVFQLVLCWMDPQQRQDCCLRYSTPRFENGCNLRWKLDCNSRIIQAHQRTIHGYVQAQGKNELKVEL